MSLLNKWNLLPAGDAMKPILACCGSQAFAAGVLDGRPYADLEDLLKRSNALWWSLSEADWLEAFACHPRIGESATGPSHQFAAWSQEEQFKAGEAAVSVLNAIAARNKEYEARHGFTYIVCATGRSAADLLSTLERRIGNSTAAETKEAAEQQRQITDLRLRKWLSS